MRAVIACVAIAAFVAPLRSARAVDELVAISEIFALKKVSGSRLLAPKREGNEIFVRLSGQEPQYLGFTDARPGEVSFAVSGDGRSLVFHHSEWKARPESKLKPGIYQYVYGAGLKLLHPGDGVTGYSHWQGEKNLPPDILAFRFRGTKMPKDSVWGLRATGEEFPLALLDANPLHWAAFDGRTEACEKLINEGLLPNATTYWNFTALDLAIIRNHEETAIRLLELGADPVAGRYPALNRAVMLGRMKVVQALLARGADVNRADDQGYTPLHLAVFAGSRLVGGVNEFFPDTVTPRSFLDSNVSVPLVEMLLAKGANPALRDRYGTTALGSVGRGTPEEVKQLLQAARPAEADACDESLLYETADAHPAIRWISTRPSASSDAALGCILRSNKDDATIDVASYMSSKLYRFVRECRPDGDRVYRLFQYKEPKRPYLLRLHKDLLVEPRTYIVVVSHRLPVGSYQHSIAQTGNNASSMTLCPPGTEPGAASELRDDPQWQRALTAAATPTLAEKARPGAAER